MYILRHIPELFSAFNDLLFPPHCLVCNTDLPESINPLLCAECLDTVQLINSPLCQQCGKPFPTGEDHLCGDCIQGKFQFDYARTPFVYSESAREMLLSLKFKAASEYAVHLAALVHQAKIIAQFSEPDVIIPVPLHFSRLRKRGYN